VALVSGGLDSTVATWWALDQGWDVTGLTVHYAKRPQAEVAAARAVVDEAGIELVEVDLPWLRELENPVHPRLENDELAEGHPRGYVPARNAVFYALAAHHAEVLGAERIVAGHNGVDPDRFPDASEGYLEELVGLLGRGLVTDPDLAVELPLAGASKREVVARGVELGAPLRSCWSCYKPRPEPCGAYPSCEARQAAFEAVGVP